MTWNERVLFEKLGREMYAMTTTVHSPNIPFVEQCEMIPGIWEHLVQERDRLREIASGVEGTGTHSSTEYERITSWLRNLGNKYLGDGIHDGIRASTILEVIEREIGSRRQHDKTDSDTGTTTVSPAVEG
jgi:hypothetical protein